MNCKNGRQTSARPGRDSNFPSRFDNLPPVGTAVTGTAVARQTNSSNQLCCECPQSTQAPFASRHIHRYIFSHLVRLRMLPSMRTILRTPAAATQVGSTCARAAASLSSYSVAQSHRCNGECCKSNMHSVSGRLVVASHSSLRSFASSATTTHTEESGSVQATSPSAVAEDFPGAKQGIDKFMLMFTCKVCETRTARVITKVGCGAMALLTITKLQIVS